MNSVKRMLFLVLGLSLVAVGVVGVFLPGIPTTGPLIGASFLLAKSNPRLEQKLRSNRFIQNHVPFLDSTLPIPLRARIWALVCMWTSIGISCLLMHRYGNVPWPFIPATLALGIVGTIAILTYRRLPRRRAARSRISTVSPLNLVEMQLLSECRRQ